MGLFIFLITIFVLQLIVIALIIFALKKRLDRQLVELAIQKFELLSAGHIGPEEKDVVVVTTRKLEDGARRQLLNIGIKKVHRTLNFVAREDKAIKGGMIIKFKNFSIDYSLASRLKESGLMGKIFR